RQGDPRAKGLRQVFLSVSKDMEKWTEPQPVMLTDEMDHREARVLKRGLHSEFYNMSAFPYGGQWLGFVTHFRRTATPAQGGREVKSPAEGGRRGHDGIFDVQRVHSRDGRHWNRSSDRRPVSPLGPHSYDAGSILGLCNAPVVVGDEMWMYCAAMT